MRPTSRLIRLLTPLTCRYVALSKDLLTAARHVASSEDWKPWLQVPHNRILHRPEFLKMCYSAWAGLLLLRLTGRSIPMEVEVFIAEFSTGCSLIGTCT